MKIVKREVIKSISESHSQGAEPSPSISTSQFSYFGHAVVLHNFLKHAAALC